MQLYSHTIIVHCIVIETLTIEVWHFVHIVQRQCAQALANMFFLAGKPCNLLFSAKVWPYLPNVHLLWWPAQNRDARPHVAKQYSRCSFYWTCSLFTTLWERFATHFWILALWLRNCDIKPCQVWFWHTFSFLCLLDVIVCILFILQGSPVSAQLYRRYPEGLGAALYREHFDFNAEPPWDPSW